MQPRPDAQQPEGSLREGFDAQTRVLGALIVRDLMTRFGRANVGFLWVILEPMLLVSLVLLVRAAIFPPYEHDLEMVVIVLTGYMPLTLYRHITNIGPNLYRRSIPFLYHRHITFLDVLLARSALEFAATTAALVAVYAILLTLQVCSPMKDPGLCAAGWFTMGYLSFGLASLLAILTEVSDTAERFIQPLQYIMLPISGTFYMIAWLPSSVQEVAWYIPLVHCYEMFRAGFFGEEVQTTYAVWYPVAWGTVMAALGIGLIDYVRDRVHTG
ncbi:MAG: ABC transporter permease [Hyphomicrobiaceae bacterium]